MGVLRHARVPVPQISDDIGIWLPARAVATLRAHTISRWQNHRTDSAPTPVVESGSRARSRQCASH